MTGATLNAAGIVIGGLAGILVLRGRRFAPATEVFLKLTMGCLTVFYGLRLAWLSVGGPFSAILKQLAVAALAVTLGKLSGHLMRLQHASNRLGQYAVKLIHQNKPDSPHRFSNGLNACAILFCASPLGILGAVHDGLPAGPDSVHYYYPLAIKSIMDGLATAGFVVLFGWGAILSALPVFVFLASITLACQLYAEPFLRMHGLLDSVNLTGGLILCTMSLVIFEFKKVELADFLPSLLMAPLLTWLWK